MRIMILGGGFGGAYCAQALEKTLRRIPAEVLLIDRNNYFVFYPLLMEAGTGSLEPRHAVVSLRAFLKQSAFRMAEVLDVNPQRREVTLRPVGSPTSETVSCDHLVIALGSATRLPDVPGLSRFGYQMKTLADAVSLRDRAISLLEQADASPLPGARPGLLHFVVVGGNLTGVEVAGELDVFLRRASRLYRNVRREDCRVTLVEIAPRILSALDEDLAAYATRHLERRGMTVRLNCSVAEIREDRVVLDGGEVLPAATVIWCAGIEPNPLVRRLPLPLDPRGYILCERDLRVRGFPNVWAIGDCAVIPDPSGKPYPATAQHSVREGVHLARNLANVLKGRPAVPFEYSSIGSLAALGCRTAVARVYGLKLSGFPAYFLWRTIYWLKMPGWARKARLTLDWTVDLFFSREFVQLGVHRNPGKPAD